MFRRHRRPDLWRDVKHRRGGLLRRRQEPDIADLSRAVTAIASHNEQLHRHAEAKRALRSSSFRMRDHLVPFWAILGCWAAGLATQFYGLVVVAVAAMVLVPAVALVGFCKNWTRTVYVGACAGVTLAWLYTAVDAGVWRPMAGWLWALGGLLALPWWLHHRIRGDAPPQPDSSDEEIWEARVASPGKKLKGSALVGHHRVHNGWTATASLVPGEQTYEDAISAAPLIASAYEKPVTHAVIEPTPDGIACHAKVLMLDTNPLQKIQYWPGPSLDPRTGTCEVGVYADGASARFRFWAPGSGAVHSLIAGAPDAGKSRFLDMLLAEASHSDLIVPWIIDPQSGQSLPRWIDYVDWAALDQRNAMRQLRAISRIMYARSAHFARVEWEDQFGRVMRGKDFFDPTPEFPLLVCFIDEAHAVLHDPEAVRIVEDIGKMGRKTGVSIALVTQLPSVKELGGEMTLRSMVASGNVVVFRTADRVTSGMAFNGALPVDPSALPREFPNGERTSGLGYILGPAARPVQMRTYLVEDPHYWASSAPRTPLGDLSAAAGGDDYAHRHDPDYEPAPAQPPAAPASAAPPGPQLTAVTNVADQTVRDRVVSVLDQPMHRGDIADAATASLRQVQDVLRELVNDGVVVKQGKGYYAPAAVAAAVADE